MFLQNSRVILQFVAGHSVRSHYLSVVELVIKLYADKASGLGIKFDTEYKAQKAYEELLSALGGGPIAIVFELKNGSLELQLISLNNGRSITHASVVYNPEHLKRLQASYKPNLLLNYLHVFAKQNIYYVARPNRQPNFMKIESISFFPSLSAAYG